jgi:hypothetical protein
MTVKVWDENHHLRYEMRITDIPDAWHFAANMTRYGYRVRIGS